LCLFLVERERERGEKKVKTDQIDSNQIKSSAIEIKIIIFVREITALTEGVLRLKAEGIIKEALRWGLRIEGLGIDLRAEIELRG